MKKYLEKIIIIIFIIILLYSGFKIYIWNMENKKSSILKEKINDAIKIEKKKNKIDFEMLKEENSDTKAYIKINNTNISYPVLKTSNNDFYLNHSFDKNENSAGWIFFDYTNKLDDTDKNIVIYGHNRRDGSMFGTLKNILNQDWYNNEDNLSILFIDEKGEHIFKIFSIYTIENEDYYIKTNFNSDNEYEEFKNTIKNRSIKEFNVDINDINNNILTLSTCANNNKYRVVLHAKKIK